MNIILQKGKYRGNFKKYNSNPATIKQGESNVEKTKEYKMFKANYEAFGKYLPGVSDVVDGLTAIAQMSNGNYKDAALSSIFLISGSDFFKPLKSLKGAGELGRTACMDFAKDFMKKYSDKFIKAGAGVKKIEIDIGNNGLIGTSTKQLSNTGKH